MLISAKKEDLKAAGISDPSDSAARKATMREEMTRHCRRRTRGVEQTISLIESLLLSLASATAYY